MKYIMRFYGSCSHIVDTESKELFEKFSAPRTVGSHISKKKRVVQNDVTVGKGHPEEDGAKIVHVHPDRHFCCGNCIKEQMEIERLEEELRKRENKG